MQVYETVQNEDQKIHNATETQKQSYTKLNNDGQRLREKALVFETLKANGPLTSRKLSELTGRERTNICRSIYDLLNEITPQVKVAYEAPCPTTGRKVQYYAPVDWMPPKPPVMIQGSLLREDAA